MRTEHPRVANRFPRRARIHFAGVSAYNLRGVLSGGFPLAIPAPARPRFQGLLRRMDFPP